MSMISTDLHGGAVRRDSDRYDVVVLGGGTAGLVSSMIAAGAGARVRRRRACAHARAAGAGCAARCGGSALSMRVPTESAPAPAAGR